MCSRSYYFSDETICFWIFLRWIFWEVKSSEKWIVFKNLEIFTFEHLENHGTFYKNKSFYKRSDNFEMTFAILGFLQKMNERIRFFCQTVLKRICSFIFWENPRIPKSPFEIIWPLSIFQKFWMILLCVITKEFAI